MRTVWKCIVHLWFSLLVLPEGFSLETEVGFSVGIELLLTWYSSIFSLHLWCFGSYLFGTLLLQHERRDGGKRIKCKADIDYFGSVCLGLFYWWWSATDALYLLTELNFITSYIEQLSIFFCRFFLYFAGNWALLQCPKYPNIASLFLWLRMHSFFLILVDVNNADHLVWRKIVVLTLTVRSTLAQFIVTALIDLDFFGHCQLFVYFLENRLWVVELFVL